MLKKWNDLPEKMRCPEVRAYYKILKKKKPSLFLKRLGDIVLALIMLIILAIPMLIIAFMIKKDSPGPVFYRQERISRYGKSFRIHKFRTMVDGADKVGSAVTVKGDRRITQLGSKIRHYRLDELPQLFDVLSGKMTFVGTRPEAAKYVDFYSNEMLATLLMPAGITSRASILYKDEAKLLEASQDVDKTYIEEILPAKMAYNLDDLKNFSLKRDIKTMLDTFKGVFL